jgi:signal transduction histidine kinase
MRRPTTSVSAAAVGFALVWIISAVPIVGSVAIARDAADVLERTLARYADDLMHASEAQVAAERMVAAGRGYLLTREQERLVRSRAAEDQLAAALQSLDRGSVEPSERALLGDVQRSADEYRRLLDSAIEMAANDDDRRDLAEKLREDLIPAREILDQKLGRLVVHKQQLQVTARQRAAATASQSVRITVILGGLALLLSALLAWLFTRRLADTSRREQAHAEKAMSALAARDELLRIVAHDLRNPLTAIALRASSIAHHAPDDEDTRSAKAIESTCHRMAFLIESLLDAAGVEEGRLAVRPEPCLALDVVTSVIDTFTPAARAKSILLEVYVSPPNLGVWADRERLFQVLSNLIGNALKFTPEKGAVALSVRRAPGAAQFEVRDTGVGIAPDDLARVFDRYWKTEVSGAKGVGLGLYIVKGIVDAHDGRIWVESTIGAGTSFVFELPNGSARAPELRGEIATPSNHLEGGSAGEDRRLLH